MGFKELPGGGAGGGGWGVEARPRGGGYAGPMAWGPGEGGEEPKPHFSTQTGSPGFRFWVSLFLAG